MLGCLRLLRRFSFEIPPASSLLTTPSLNTSRNGNNNHFSLYSPPKTTGGGKGSSRLPSLLHHLKKPSECFCTRAIQTEETGIDSLFPPYLSVRIRCSKPDADILSEALLCFGASSVSMDELSICEDINEIYITCIFTDGQDVHKCLARAADSINLKHIPSYDVSMGEKCDWVKNIQETFHPIEIADGLWIVPKWRTPPDLQATNIILDPGMTFGTGEHPTTKLCLLLLNGLIKGGENFLDYGTGSGILAIAAVKMGAALSVGIDIDPEAVESARQNIALNEIDANRMLVSLTSSKVCPHSLDGITQNNLEEQSLYSVDLNAEKEQYDIVIANILLNPLMELAEDLVAYGKPGAIIGVSGILSEQVQQIEELYSQYLDSISISHMDGWACLSGPKK